MLAQAIRRTKLALNHEWIAPVWRERRENVVFQFLIVKNPFEVEPAQSYSSDCKFKIDILFADIIEVLHDIKLSVNIFDRMHVM